MRDCIDDIDLVTYREGRNKENEMACRMFGVYDTMLHDADSFAKCECSRSGWGWRCYISEIQK